MYTDLHPCIRVCMYIYMIVVVDPGGGRGGSTGGQCPPPSPMSLSSSRTGSDLYYFYLHHTVVSDNVLQRSDTLTRVKLFSDLSQSPYCLEYERLKLGSLTFSASNKGSDWRVTAINMGYAVCNRLVVDTDIGYRFCNAFMRVCAVNHKLKRCRKTSS